jgi:hypothetical protein
MWLPRLLRWGLPAALNMMLSRQPICILSCGGMQGHCYRSSTGKFERWYKPQWLTSPEIPPFASSSDQDEESALTSIRVSICNSFATSRRPFSLSLHICWLGRPSTASFWPVSLVGVLLMCTQENAVSNSVTSCHKSPVTAWSNGRRFLRYTVTVVLTPCRYSMPLLHAVTGPGSFASELKQADSSRFGWHTALHFSHKCS